MPWLVTVSPIDVQDLKSPETNLFSTDFEGRQPDALVGGLLLFVTPLTREDTSVNMTDAWKAPRVAFAEHHKSPTKPRRGCIYE